ncbi:hypothetical protein PROFUN_02229 [Planoprotostelium fungivorum]|uniref:Uncharacterized protein n=1 Tax=Planoprotostelium fungivorum TaxID=1890364 RepID=A0A2P6NYB3_9EUKA|nr:hypothetical protein PROFUN_02229 [Planoprotostelium fungivorum]
MAVSSPSSGRAGSGSAVSNPTAAPGSSKSSSKGGLLRFYTEDSTGLQVGPTTVLVSSLLFIAAVVVLHIWGRFHRVITLHAFTDKPGLQGYHKDNQPFLQRQSDPNGWPPTRKTKSYGCGRVSFRRKYGNSFTADVATTKDHMDHSARKEIGRLIEYCTNEDNNLNVNTKPLRNVKICYDLLFTRMKKPNSQYFRDLLGRDIKDFMKLCITGGATSLSTMDIPSELPPPHECAMLLREKGLQILEQWFEKYGHKAPQHTLQMKFPEVRTAALIEERRQKEAEARTQEILRLKYEAIKEQQSNLIEELSNILEELDNLFEMLVPKKIEDYFSAHKGYEQPNNTKSEEHINQAGDKEEETDDIKKEVMTEEEYFFLLQQQDDMNGAQETAEDIMHRGAMGSREYSITISSTSNIQQTEDNRVLFESIRERMEEIQKRYIPILREWEIVLIKVDKPDQKENQEKEALLQKVANHATDIDRAWGKCTQLGIYMKFISQIITLKIKINRREQLISLLKRTIFHSSILLPLYSTLFTYFVIVNSGSVSNNSMMETVHLIRNFNKYVRRHCIIVELVFSWMKEFAILTHPFCRTTNFTSWHFRQFEMLTHLPDMGCQIVQLLRLMWAPSSLLVAWTWFCTSAQDQTQL